MGFIATVLGAVAVVYFPCYHLNKSTRVWKQQQNHGEESSPFRCSGFGHGSRLAPGASLLQQGPPAGETGFKAALPSVCLGETGRPGSMGRGQGGVIGRTGGNKRRDWGGEQEKWQWEAGRRGWSWRGGQHYADASFRGTGTLHPDAYLMSSYSASVPMIW